MTVTDEAALDDLDAEEEVHVHPKTRDHLVIPDADALVERRARWAAATVVLSYMATTGLTSGAGECPHCDCPLLYMHETDTGAWHTVGNLGFAYECVRCGATTVMMDHAPYVYDYLVDADKRARQTRASARDR